MLLCLGRLVEALVEIGVDRVLPHNRLAVLDQYRDAVRSGGCDEHGSRIALDRHLVDQVVEPELGQALADAVRGGAPLGLVELEHHAAPATTRWSDSKRSWRLPQTASQSEKTPSSLMQK